VLVQLCFAVNIPVNKDGGPIKKPQNLPLPGVDLLGSGYNALTGQANLLPVFAFSNNQHKTFTPAYARGTVYDVPDQVSVSNTGETGEIIIQDVYDHYQDFLQTYRSSFTFSAGIDIAKVFGLAFKYDKELYRVNHELSNNSIAQGHSKHWWSLYQVEGLPAFLQTLDPTIQAAFGQMPASIGNAADAAKYDQFFNYWGTHYVALANYGAYIHMDSFVGQDLIQKYSLQWVSTQMSLTFHYYLFQVSAGDFHNKSDIKIDNTFQQHSESYVFFQGGDPALASTATLSQWLTTIEAMPHFLNATMRPLSELTTNAGVKATMNAAMNSYIANNGSVALTDFGIMSATENVAKPHQAVVAESPVEVPIVDAPQVKKPEPAV